MEISEKVAYLKGLAEGLALDTESKEGKLISVMIGILEEVGLSIEDLEENTVALGEEIDTIVRLAFQVNEALKAFFLSVGIRLVDFKLEFGRTGDGTIVLADEISPDTCRLWDKDTNEKLDKDRFRRDLGHVESAYQEVMRRLLEKQP